MNDNFNNKSIEFKSETYLILNLIKELFINSLDCEIFGLLITDNFKDILTEKFDVIVRNEKQVKQGNYSINIMTKGYKPVMVGSEQKIRTYYKKICCLKFASVVEREIAYNILSNFTKYKILKE